MANMYKIVGTGFLSRGTKFSGLDLKRVYFVSSAGVKLDTTTTGKVVAAIAAATFLDAWHTLATRSPQQLTRTGQLASRLLSGVYPCSAVVWRCALHLTLSQAVDVASLSKVPLQTVLNVVMVLGFLGEHDLLMTIGINKRD